MVGLFAAPKVPLPVGHLYPPHLIHVPWTHRTQHPKLHLDRFSRFCTAHDKETLYFIIGRPFQIRSTGSEVIGFNLGSGFSPDFSAPPSGETTRQTTKRFRGERTCSRSSITMPSLVGLGFHPPPGWPKTLSYFLSVCLSVCLFVRHAFERQTLCAQFRHEGVGVQKQFWCHWIGEGL